MNENSDQKGGLRDHHEHDERQGRRPPRQGTRGVHVDAERDEEDRDEEVHQRPYPSPQIVVERQLRQADARQECTELHRQSHGLGAQDQEEAP
jgi:Trm5-related predicted tRNA methylase